MVEISNNEKADLGFKSRIRTNPGPNQQVPYNVGSY